MDMMRTLKFESVLKPVKVVFEDGSYEDIYHTKKCITCSKIFHEAAVDYFGNCEFCNDLN